MPFPHWHSARQLPPDFPAYRRKKSKGTPGVIFIIGIRGRRQSAVQSVRFDAKQWTPAAAQAWLSRNGFIVTTFEPASGPHGAVNTTAPARETTPHFWW